ncbi:serine/threonine-protein kinase [Nocardia thailandica]|uniref:non-specific serine/threonine protein kinase n=2 Tax=Nocardia thailandica TaxID=257275 RepID=A0ABW6PNE5_9NOCA
MTSDRLIAGRYRLTDPIGTGAMGVVWRATDVRLRRTVAVKQLLLAPGLTGSQALEAKLRAMREGRIAARLHHPNAITVFDVAEEDGQPWLVMEYMNAPSLAVKLAGGATLPPLEVAGIGAQAAAALAAAHKAGILHRDVKPANLLVGDDGTVKLTDFGISHATGDVTVTATGFLAGTPAYLAPEIARGENPETASDVFALGSTLYAAVEGTPPFGEGDNPLAVLHAVARGTVPEPKKAGPLAPVLMWLLTVDIAKRPDMAAARVALEDVAAGRTPSLPASATAVLPATTDAPTTVLAGAGAAARPAAPAPAPVRGPGTLDDLPDQASAKDSRAVRWLAATVAALVVALAVLIVTRDRGEPQRTAEQQVVVQTTLVPVTDAEGSVSLTPRTVTVTVPVTPTGTTGPAPGAAPGQTTVPPGSTTPGATTTKPGTPTTTITTTAFGPPTPDRIAAFIAGYYGMLPGNVSGAWSQLSPGYQAQTGGFAQYSSFWSTVRSVGVGAITPSGADRAVVTLTYRLADGTVTSENRWIQVGGSGGSLQIVSSGV